MNIYRKGNIVNYWDEIISKDEYDEIYDKIKMKVLNDIFKDSFLKMIEKGKFIDKRELSNLLKDDHQF